MNDEEVLQNESQNDNNSIEVEESTTESSSTDEVIPTESTVAYQETIQYDLNYNFGFMSIWFGIVCGFLGVLVFFKGFKND